MDATALPKLDTFSQHTTVYIDPSKVETFWEALKPVFEKTAAAPECVYSEAFENPAEPGKITWVANWAASPEWVMTEHLNKDYYKLYLEATEPLFTRPREVKILKREKPFISGKKSNFKPVIGDNNGGLSLHVTVQIKPECDEDFRVEWNKIFGVVAGEPECLYFEVFSDPATTSSSASSNTPVVYSWMENWTKPVEWLMSVQLAKDYYKPYLAATEPMFAGDRKFEVLKRKEGLVAWKRGNFEGAEIGELRA